MKPVGATNIAKLVAVIDDDAAVRRATEDVLRSHGFEVIAAKSFAQSNTSSRRVPSPCQRSSFASPSLGCMLFSRARIC